MERATPCPWHGPRRRVFRMRRSKVPCNKAMRSSLFSWVAIRPKYLLVRVECQPKRLNAHSNFYMGQFWKVDANCENSSDTRQKSVEEIEAMGLATWARGDFWPRE